MDASPTPAAPVRRRVAVIAVHGVGSPPAGETARNVTELLLRSSAAPGRYHGFEEHPIYVPTAPLDSGDAGVKGAAASPPGAAAPATPAYPLSPSKGRTTFEGASIEEAALRPDIAFSRQLLAGYESEREPYLTTETIGTRKDAMGEIDVHVFEMHWADLSRVGQGLLRLFGSAYQLIQHLSQIGRNTVDVGKQVARANEELKKANQPASDIGPYKLWKRYAGAHAFVVWLFTLWIPVFTLLMLAFVPLFIPAAVKPGSALLVGLVAWAVVAIVLGALLMYFGPARRRTATTFVGFMFFCLVAALAVFVGVSPDRQYDVGTKLITGVVVLLTLIALFGVVRLYNRTHDGALLLVLVGFFTVWNTGRKASAELFARISLDFPESVREVGLIGVQQSYSVLMTIWLALWVAVIYAIWCRIVLVRSTRGAARLRASRTGFTARVTLALSTFSFIVTALVSYRMLVYLAERVETSIDLLPRPLLLDKPALVLPTAHMVGFMPSEFVCPVDVPRPCAAQLFDQFIASGGTSGFALALFGVALVLVMMSWFFAIIAATSIKKPDPKAGNGKRLGLWMTDGFRWLRIGGTTLGATLLLALVVGVVLDVWPAAATWLQGKAPWLAHVMSREWTISALDKVTIAVLASAATLGAARLRIEALASRARPALGVILDVDHYLREQPKEGTPRARMFERFVSLLRYIDDRPVGEKFDRVVIIAHSQGTVITADLLRFLNFAETSDDHALVSAERFRLLTIGSPLRQLYGANFPYLYRWVNDTDPTPGVKYVPATPQVIDQRTPDPASLRVGEWVNLYTSGDYVGRNLWTDDDWGEVWDRRPAIGATKGVGAIEGNGRRERCLGAGTHTFYWTDTEVGAELDRLIVAAPPVRPPIGFALKGATRAAAPPPAGSQ